MNPNAPKENVTSNDERFRELVEHVSDWIWEVDQNGVYTYASPRITDILGYSPAEVVGKTPFDLMPAEEADRVRPIFHSLVIEKAPITSLENVNVHRDGHLVILETSGHPIFNEAGDCIGYRGVDRDITSRKEIERRQQQLLDIIEASPDFIATADIKGKMLYRNPAAQRMLGSEGDEELSLVEWNSAWARELVLTKGIPTAIKEGVWKGETSILKKDGTEIPVSQTIVAHKSDNGEIQFLSTIARDITEMKEMEKIIKHQALYDSLTDLPNRRFLHVRFSELIEGEGDNQQQRFAVLFLDLDNFKEINDTLGHRFGDHVLQTIACRLKNAVREGDFISRYGGDEFIILLENIQQLDDVDKVAERIVKDCYQTIQLDGHSIDVSGSVGISLYPDHAQDGETLIRKADQAMYAIKKKGKNDYRLL